MTVWRQLPVLRSSSTLSHSIYLLGKATSVSSWGRRTRPVQRGWVLGNLWQEHCERWSGEGRAVVGAQGSFRLRHHLCWPPVQRRCVPPKLTASDPFGLRLPSVSQSFSCLSVLCSAPCPSTHCDLKLSLFQGAPHAFCTPQQPFQSHLLSEAISCSPRQTETDGPGLSHLGIFRT